jgi:hypothetical protein
LNVIEDQLGDTADLLAKVCADKVGKTAAKRARQIAVLKTRAHHRRGRAACGLKYPRRADANLRKF